ncbi:MAG: DUF4249 domain-containing protein [Bacteroidetes bacterium]|nr:DUF4249 domain-containing protein [Bacteroidota bacterium]
MNKIIYISIVLLFSIFACEKVIDVDLNEAHPGIVIEGNLSRSPISAEVRLSKTGSYFGESSNDKISGATVIIKNDFGESFSLIEFENGFYKSFEITPEVGATYTLTVETEGEVYKASSTLHQTVQIDTLSYFYDEGFGFMDEGYLLKALFTDPSEIENYYRIKIYVGDTLKNENNDFIIFDDRVIDGNSIEITLRGNIFDVGDTVSVELISLDKGAYEYYNGFQELINVNPGSAAPANPTSNISNGALGYFSAWSSDKKTVIIKE